MQSGVHVFKNIVVAVDGSQHSMTAAQLAAQIAQACGGTVEALFIKDTSIIRAPYWRDFGALTLPVTRFDHALDEFFQMRGEAVLQTLKERHGMSGTIVAGRIDREIIQAARDADLLAMGAAGEAHEDNNDEEHIAARVIRTVRGTSTPVLSAPASATPIARVRLAYCKLVSGNAVAGAVDISREMGLPLSATALGDGDDGRDELARAVLTDHGLSELTPTTVPGDAAHALVSATQPGDLVIMADDDFDDLDRAIRGLRAPVLLFG